MSWPKRVLVTGGAGFIGSHVCARLLHEGVEVVCLDDFNDGYDPAEKRGNAAANAQASGFRVVEGDIRDVESVRTLLSEFKPQCVVHLAARAGVRPSVEHPFLYESTNVAGTLSLLDASVRAEVSRFVFGSSSSVYGINTKVPFAEDDPTKNTVSPYAATKLAGEAWCNTYAHLYQMPVTSLRFFTVYGPRQRPDLAIRKFMELIRRGETITLYGDGTSSRDYTFVDDIVSGVAAATKRETSGHEVFNLGNSVPHQLKDLVAAIETVVGKPANISWEPMQPGDVPRTFADITKARAELGFAPETALPQGLEQMLAWMEAAQRDAR